MAQFPGITLTNAGLNMITESQASSTALIFTGLKMGDGTLTTGEDVKVLTAVKSALLTVPPESHTNSGSGQVRLRFVISNGTLETGFFARELGIYAKVGASGTEQLYGYTNAGNLTDYIPDKNTPIDEQIIDIYLVVGNASSVAIVSDGSIIYVSKAEFDDHKAATDAHANLLNLRKNSTAYVVGDCKRSATMESWKYAECIVAGTTAATEPTWGDVGSTVTDGGVAWIVRDRRQGTSVGKIPALVDVGSGVAGLPAVDGSKLTGIVSSGSGWMKLADGTLIQNGRNNSRADGVVEITFPLLFINDAYSITGTHVGDSMATVFAMAAYHSVGYCTLGVAQLNGDVAAGWTVDWIAIGRWKA